MRRCLLTFFIHAPRLKIQVQIGWQLLVSAVEYYVSNGVHNNEFVAEDYYVDFTCWTLWKAGNVLAIS